MVRASMCQGVVSDCRFSVQMRMWLWLPSAGAAHATAEEQSLEQTLPQDQARVFPDTVTPQVHPRHQARAEPFPHLCHLSSAPCFVWLFNQNPGHKEIGAFPGWAKKPGRACSPSGKIFGLWGNSSVILFPQRGSLVAEGRTKFLMQIPGEQGGPGAGQLVESTIPTV